MSSTESSQELSARIEKLGHDAGQLAANVERVTLDASSQLDTAVESLHENIADMEDEDRVATNELADLDRQIQDSLPSDDLDAE
ncbi:MAG: hypothetical protein Q7S47_01580 [bacterium]|nr:hypothetical protein [bacterium]